MIDTYYNTDSVPGRTGWGAYKLTFDLKTDGSGTCWRKHDEVMTSDSGRDERYEPSEYRTEILFAIISTYRGGQGDKYLISLF